MKFSWKPCACLLFVTTAFCKGCSYFTPTFFSSPLYSTLRDSPNPGGGNRLSRNEKNLPSKQEGDFFSSRFNSCSKTNPADRTLRPPQFALKSELQQSNSERTRMCWRNNMGPPSSSPPLKKVLPNPNVSPHPNLPLQYGICPFHNSRSIGLVVCVSISCFKWCMGVGKMKSTEE